jgi:uncharacterized protein YecT (DUF1311 family)
MKPNNHRNIRRCLFVSIGLLAFCFTLVQAQSSDAGLQKLDDLHARALAAVEAERAHSKRDLCPKAMTTFDINQCFAAEVAISNANYLKLVRAIGAMLRIGDDRTSAAAPERLPFDDAESAWQLYKDKACKAAGWVNEGGTIVPMVEMGCAITVTHQHMEELWILYSDLANR